MLKRRYFVAIALAVIFLIGLVLIAKLMQGEEKNEQIEAEEKPQEHVQTPSPLIQKVTVNQEQIGRYEKLELTIELEADYENPYDPEQLDLSADFISPTGVPWRINGYFDGVGRAWKLRFSPDEVGEWTYQLRVRDVHGEAEDELRQFMVVPSRHHGWITNNDDNVRFLDYHDGTSFYGVGVAYPWGITEWGLDQIAASGGNLVTYWNGNYDTAGSGGGDDQLESTDWGIGKIDPLKAKRIDELLESFEARDLHMNFVIWPHDSLADKIPGWPATWKESAYSTIGEAKDFYSDEQMWRYQERLYRYIIARWGHSRALGIWDLIVEINGTDGWAFGYIDEANAWAKKIHDYFKQNDPYGHPTMGSMAGNEKDYWEEGYRIFDLADRENYYNLHYRAYAEDIQKRWNSFEKPNMIGETGNVNDPKVYHQAIWAALSNGLASAPIWWDYTHTSEAFFEQMKHFAAFVKEIDFTELRKPVTLGSGTVDKRLASTMMLEDGTDAGDWVMPDWADANKNESGSLFKRTAEDGAIGTQMRFAGGGYAQGYLQQNVTASDWTGYDELVVEVYAEYDGHERLKVRPVILPDHRWTEGDDPSDVTLPSGEWTTLRVPLLQSPDGYWRDGLTITEENLRNITNWGIKVYTAAAPASAEPAVIRIRNAVLQAAKPQTIAVKESEGWLMAGSHESYGWMVTEDGVIAGKQAEASGLPDGQVVVQWYDPWNGAYIHRSDEVVIDGKLLLTAPELQEPDIAFRITAQ